MNTYTYFTKLPFFSFNIRSYQAVKERFCALDSSQRKAFFICLVEIIKTTGLQIGLFIAHPIIRDLSPLPLQRSVSYGFKALHAYYSLSYLKYSIVLTTLFNLAKNQKNNTLVTQFSEKEFETLRFFYSFQQNASTTIPVKQILEVVTIDFFNRFNNLQRMPLLGHKINGKAFATYAEFIQDQFSLPSDHVDTVSIAISSYKQINAFLKLVAIQKTILELTQNIKDKSTKKTKAQYANETAGVVAVKELVKEESKLNLLNQIDHPELQPLKESLKFCLSVEIPQSTPPAPTKEKPITLEERLQNFGELNRLDQLLERYILLRKLALEGKEIPIEQKLLLNDYKFLVKAWKKFETHQAFIVSLKEKGRADERVDILYKLYTQFDLNMNAYQTGDLLFFSLLDLRFFKFIKKKSIASFMERLIHKIGHPHHHLGLFCEHPESSRPSKIALGCTLDQSPTDIHYKEIQSEQRYLILPLRIDIRPLIQSLPKELREALQQSFLQRVKEICLGTEIGHLKNRLNINKLMAPESIDLPFSKIYRFFSFLYHHEGSSSDKKVEEMHLKDYPELMCSSFVMLTIIEGLHVVNKQLREKGFHDQQIKYPITEKEIIPHLHTKRALELLQASGLISSVKVDFMKEIIK